MRDYFLGCTVHVHHKGGNSKAEMARANELEDQRNQLMEQQLQMQRQQLAIANPVLKQIIEAGGMLPQQEAAMRTQAMQGLGQQYQNLQGQLGQALTARGITGGQFAGGGDIARNFGQLGAMEAGQQSELLNQIQLAKGQGLMGALGTTLGEAGMFGQQGLGFGGQGVNALGIGQQAGKAADEASSAFWGSMFGALGGLGSAAIGKCWVAAELYGGWFTPETCAVRNWLWNAWYMRPFCLFYMKFGQRWADLIRSNKLARLQTKRLFDLFLRLARG